MAHHQEHNRRQSTIQNFLKMLHLSTASEMPIVTDEDLCGDADEPPDELAPLRHIPKHHSVYSKSSATPGERRESLLTRALMHEPDSPDHAAVRGPSSASTYSNASMPSTADLTSDGGLTSPARTNSPSPPPPLSHYAALQGSQSKEITPSKVAIAPSSKDQAPTVAKVSEPAVEANLGRKRCITFACGRKDSFKGSETSNSLKVDEAKPAEPPKRRCTLTFACPTRTSQAAEKKGPTGGVEKTVSPSKPRHTSPAPPIMRRSSSSATSASELKCKASGTADVLSDQLQPQAKDVEQDPELSEATRFHEFASSYDEDDAWVHESTEHKKKITLSDCLMKENVIRKLGEEAEEEAQQEEEEEEELEELEEDNEDEDISDDGNESDNEEGFADSDEEEDAGSEYEFWAPAPTTAATSVEQLDSRKPSIGRRPSESSIESTLPDLRRQPSLSSRILRRKRLSKVPKMRPSTPDLPDSTDFVCGTLDEDRPLEAAYMSCLEQRRREKHVVIPQDIDPSFPTTDPEDHDDNGADDNADGADDHLWLKDQLDGFDDEKIRMRRKSTGFRGSSPPSPVRLHSPPPKHTHRHSPPPRRLFGQSPKRPRSPPPPLKLRSPPGTRRSSLTSPTSKGPLPINVHHLAERPGLTRTKSLPRTPNPFFHRLDASRQLSTVSSMATSPNTGSSNTRDIHIRGPIDITAGLEKKRQKRKEKFWRQHCRKYAKEEQERRPAPGKGAERMKELGLECAERAKSYGLGQQAQVVISL